MDNLNRDINGSSYSIKTDKNLKNLYSDIEYSIIVRDTMTTPLYYCESDRQIIIKYLKK